jgi:hypothetical protein
MGEGERAAEGIEAAEQYQDQWHKAKMSLGRSQEVGW